MNIITKFTPGDEVHYFEDNVIVQNTILKIEANVTLNTYYVPSIALRYYFKSADGIIIKHEAQLYSSRKEIAEAVLSYKI